MQRGRLEQLPRGSSPSTDLDSGAVLARASSPLSATPRAFLRWAGSKRLLLPHIVPLLPARYGTYYEPFLGGGSLFFLLQPSKALLSDTCGDLIETFDAVRANVRAVLRHLVPLRPNRSFYYTIRSRRSTGQYKRAAEFIYLNKTSWNGLYRVNSHGLFNVPYGRPKTDNIIDSVNLRACATALNKPGVRLTCVDFEEALADACRNDLVFLDPPYVTRHNNNGFVDYNKRLFCWDDQIRLANTARRLASKGARVIVANALHEELLQMYDSFTVFPITRRSTLASDSSRRGTVVEALLVSD
jgi:DNA adenine methylase